LSKRLEATAPKETEKQRMARESVEAMAELRKQKEANAAVATNEQSGQSERQVKLEILSDETAATGSRYVYVVIDGHPFEVRLANHQSGQTRGGSSRMHRKTIEERFAKLPYEVDWRVADPAQVSLAEVENVVRKVSTKDFLDEESNIAQVSDHKNPQLEVFDPATGRFKQEALESEASRTIAGEPLKTATANQIQTESQMVKGKATTPQPAEAVKPVKVLDRHLEEARAAVADLHGESLERALDIIDELEGQVTTGAVRAPAEMADVVQASRERVAEALHQKPWKRLSSAQRKAIDGELRVSTTSGAAADTAQQGLGEKYADLTTDDFINAVLDAGEGRLLQRRKADSKEVLAMAEEIARAEVQAAPADKAETQKPAKRKRRNIADEYLSEEINYGGEIRTRGSLISEWQKQGVPQGQIDAYMGGAKTIQRVSDEVTTWDQAAAAALESLKLDTNGQLHAFGLLPVAWNQLVDLAKLAVRGGRKLGEAIDWAITEFKRLNPDATLTDEAGARAQLMVEVPTRATGQKITSSTIISDETKQASQAYIYEPRSNRTDQQTADGLVTEFGVDAATALWRNPPADFPGAVKSKLLGSITRTLAEAERTARVAGDTAAQQTAMQQQADLWNEALPRITNTAQELQAMNGMVAMSPDAQVIRARREVESAGDKEIERHEAETDAMRTALDEGRADGIEAVKQDAATNTAARAAVDESIKDSDETKQAIIMELAGPWAQSEYIVNHAREAVRAKANELLNKQPRPPGLTPAAHLRQILDDLAGRAASIFAGHIQGSEPGVLLVDKLMQRLGVDKPTAVKLATSLSKEWDAQLDKARKALDTRLANARARQERREREPESNAAVDRALRKQLRDLNLKLGEAIRQAATDRTKTGEHIADRIVQASGLTGPAADALRAKLKARYDALTAEAQRRALEGISKRSGVKISKKMRDAFDRLVDLDRLAPVDTDAFFKAVRAALKLPELTEAQAKELRQLVLDAQAKPEGWQQQRIMGKVLTLVENAKGTHAWHDTAFAVWYANIFSGLPTHVANIVGNTMKAMEVLGIESLRNPLATGQIVKAFARGVESGALEAASILKTGSTEGTRLLKAEPARPLEAKIQKGGWNRVWLPWAAIARAMAAEDVVFFKGHEEVKWQLLARRVAQQEGLRGEQLDARVQDLMHGTRAAYDAAKVQAATEGLTSPLDVRRRAHEIIEQAREKDMDGSTDQARRFALEHTFNSEPYGVMGSIAEVLNTANRKLVVTRFAIPVVRIMANLANESLNYFPPVGLARVIVPKFRSDITVRAGGDVDALAFYQARALVGTALFGALLAAMFGNDDEEEKFIEITGQGPRTKNQKEQLRATGWKPNALRVGDRWYSYQESQLNIPLAILGNYSDAIKYKGLEQQDALNRTAYVMQTTLNTILDQRMLSGVGDLMDALQPESAGTADLTRVLARSGSSFVVPNAVRWIDQVFDPAVYEADDVKGALYAQTPFVRRLNRPALNALGDPVERPSMERFTSPTKPDDLMRVIAAKNAWIPMPNLDTQEVGNPDLGDAYMRPMTPDEYYAWIAESGPQIRARLTDNIGTLAAMTPEEAQAYVRNITREERAKTKSR
jgi:hypothetical protein